MSNYIQIPPDSTGKRVHTVRTATISYISGTIAFVVADTVIGLTSSAAAVVAGVTGTTSSGTLELVYISESVDFQNGEALQVSAVTNAVSSSAPVSGFVQKVVAVGSNNHLNGQTIDNKGAAVMRFSQGEGAFDSFGNLMIGKSNPIASYGFNYGDKEGTDTLSFQTIIAGSATKAHSVLTGAVKLACTTGATDSVRRTTNRYHINFPGTSQEFIVGAQIGDAGKANCTRRWGYFSSINGSFFELNGTSLRLGVRTPVTGIPVDTYIEQADWNSDIVDGSAGLSNRSFMNLDVSKWNIYFIETQFMSAAVIRFGVYNDDGDKVILHTFSGTNAGVLPSLVAGSSPVRYEQFNTGITVSSSEMSVGNIGVLTTAEIRAEQEIPHSNKTAFSGTVTVDGADIPALSMRAVQTISGLGNRKPILPHSISLRTDQPILFKWVIAGSLTAPSFALGAAAHILEVDTSATAITGGIIFEAKYLEAGSHEIEIGEHFSWLNYYINILDNGAYGDIHSITFDKVGASDATVNVAFKWAQFE